VVLVDALVKAVCLEHLDRLELVVFLAIVVCLENLVGLDLQVYLEYQD
jgi:hypothetical protein